MEDDDDVHSRDTLHPAPTIPPPKRYDALIESTKVPSQNEGLVAALVAILEELELEEL